VQRWRADLAKDAAIARRIAEEHYPGKRLAGFGALQAFISSVMLFLALPGFLKGCTDKLHRSPVRSMFTINCGSSLREEAMIRFGYLPLAGVGVAVLGLVAAPVHFQEKSSAGSNHGIVRAADLKWTPIIKGCDLAEVNGNSAAEGVPFVLRLRCTAGTKIPAHWHPTDENVTVLSGTFLVGLGDKYEPSKLEAMTPGNFANMPKEVRHFALSKTATIVQVNAIGPFKVNWVNPADVIPPDAPAKKPASAKP
jgi:quercetin dioxygenase-like cupin family protein